MSRPVSKYRLGVKGGLYTLRLPGALAARLYRLSRRLRVDCFATWEARLGRIAVEAEKTLKNREACKAFRRCIKARYQARQEAREKAREKARKKAAGSAT
jgi:hypothetical protein